MGFACPDHLTIARSGIFTVRALPGRGAGNALADGGAVVLPTGQQVFFRAGMMGLAVR